MGAQMEAGAEYPYQPEAKVNNISIRHVVAEFEWPSPGGTHQ